MPFIVADRVCLTKKMPRFSERKRSTARNTKLAIAAALFLLAGLASILWFVSPSTRSVMPYAHVSTVAGTGGEFGEPFGIAVKGNDIYVSDGQHGRIWRVTGAAITVFADGLDTPSGIAFDPGGNLIVADPGSHTIKIVDSQGSVSTIAGIAGRSGFADGDAGTALFNAPIGVASAADGKIYVADTYNDRIRTIENGKVTTLGGGEKGFADGLGENTKFDTPSGLVVWQDKILVADTGNRRIRVVESDGRVWTLAGTGDTDLVDGSLSSASFVHPTGIAVDKSGSIYVTDGNAIRKIGGGAFPIVGTISAQQRGLKDGIKSKARFNRPSGLAIDASDNLLVADSENRLVRSISNRATGHEISADEIVALRDKPAEFRSAYTARWPFDPPTTKRDIAGTLGEVRGEVADGSDDVWFHNGLDIAGAYGETARFIRDEKVLRPIAAENFDTLRELIRLPTLGYIHIRLGRNMNSEPFDDVRFQFQKDRAGKLTGVRVPRGAKFKAGDPIGTLNPMNHVHLVAGRSGSEMNAFDALILPGISDSRPPVIEKVTIYDQNWNPVETVSQNSRIKITDKTRVVVRAYDQVDGNSARRRLGVYKLGYEVLKSDKTPLADPAWTILFDRMPASDAVKLVYANESHSGATGETIFNYIVTNRATGEAFQEDFLDPSVLGSGIFVLRVFAADYFGNTSSRDIEFEVIK
jgi:sugar lactone lactonase YvrE